MNNYTKLFDIPSLPESLLKQKFISTPDDTYDPNTVENFMKETLRYTGTDKPIFEHELPRTNNVHRDLILKLHAEGSPYSHDPYHPELFLGDMTYDPRGTENNPNVSQIADQSRFRQQRYIVGKLQDDPDKRTEGLASGNAIMRATRGGYDNTASRMSGIFDDSIDTSVRRSNPNPGRTIQKVGDNLKEDQKFNQSSSEKIIPKMGYNPVSLLSNQIGVQWQVQPEGKFSVSSISNLYRSKGEVDAAANAVFRMGIQDEKFSESQQTMVSSVMAQLKDSVKKSKQIAMDAGISLTTDSQQNKFINRIAYPSKLPGGDAARGVQRMQTSKFETKHTQTFLKPFNPNKQLEQIGVIEPRTHVKQKFGDHTAMTIPKKDKMKIMRSIRRDGKMNRNGSEGFNQRYAANVKSLSKAFIQRQEQYKEKNKWNAAELSQENMLYSNAPMHKPEDRVGNVQTTKNKFYEPKEQISSNLSGQTTKIGPININNFEFDTDPTTDNAFMTRRNSAQKMGYIFNERIYDNDVSPLSEVVNTRRYISAPVLKKSDDE
jgi:hypothetical protein